MTIFINSELYLLTLSPIHSLINFTHSSQSFKIILIYYYFHTMSLLHILELDFVYEIQIKTLF